MKLFILFILFSVAVARWIPYKQLQALRANLDDDYDSDSRAVSENVDLDTVDQASYDRMRNALHSIHARVGAIGFYR
ncbi:unnamed protein product [Auanema sp. JU1783]|nr:unnamed protein product [Auanema sp. JU1783]